jgi:hypothetical protein
MNITAYKSFEEFTLPVAFYFFWILASYLPVFEEAHELIAELDLYTSFAEVSYSAPYPYVRPNVTPPGGNIILKRARHPVMEILPDMTFIPNDVNIVRGPHVTCSLFLSFLFLRMSEFFVCKTSQSCMHRQIDVSDYYRTKYGRKIDVYSTSGSHCTHGSNRLFCSM